MNRQEILAKLRENKAALRALGVSHAALFGSRARGDHRADSDIDILIELDPERPISVLSYAGMRAFIEGLFEERVDVINREGLKPTVNTEAIYAF